MDPLAARNRAQKEARLQREKGLKDPAKKTAATSSKSPAKKGASATGEHFAKKFMKEPVQRRSQDRPEAPSKFSRGEGKFTKKPFDRKHTEQEEESKRFTPATHKREASFDGDMRLNKFLAHCGIASRRAVDVLIMQGHVTVNGEIIKEMGHKVTSKDVVTFKGQVVKPEDKLVYYLLNKPRNVICTVSDERGRKTVMDVIAQKVPERIYPVGRLDRNTSGLILLTNDGDLTKKLSHPSHKVPKVYQVTLDKNLSLKDLEKIRDGITLEDGEIKADSLHYVEGESKREVQIEIHSGRNRIVRRIFEHLGYEVVKLDRTYYAGLTKKNLPRGIFRPLTKEEVRMLKHFT